MTIQPQSVLRTLTLGVAVSALLLTAIPATAEKGQFYVAPGLQWLDANNRSGLDDSLGLAIGLGYDFIDRISGELDYFSLNPDFKNNTGDVDLDHWRLDLVYDLNAKLGAFDTFVATGLGNTDYEFEDSSVWDLGAGVSYRLSDNVSWRTAVRNYLNLDHDKSDLGIDTSLVVRFGARRPAVVETPPPAPAPAPTPEPVRPAPPREEVARIDLMVNFDFDRSEVKQEFMDEIQRVADFMRQYPDVDAELEGHTDSVGTDAYNQGLSERRANAVRDVLVNRFNIPASRISTVGFGESRPIASNTTDDGRAQNRRVISVILKTIQN
ncbi:MAG: hypothetical protein RLZZ385_2779 [Pseudomonadota bacterium]|jgi:OOP family OmpA-OmpF porin